MVCGACQSEVWRDAEKDARCDDAPMDWASFPLLVADMVLGVCVCNTFSFFGIGFGVVSILLGWSHAAGRRIL